HWKLRNIVYSYQHPSEFAALEDPLISIPVYKLYIDLYYDDFEMFRNVYHSLGGIYIQIGNLPFDKRRQLRNHFVLEFVLFGGKFDEFIEPFVAEMKQLEKGKIMDVEGSECLVIASLGDVTADLPQGNDLAGVKRHGLQEAVPTITRSKEIAAEYGLCIKLPILDELKRERHLQSQHDIYHVTAGKVLRFLKITFDALSSERKSAFIMYWKSFNYPKDWQKLPNPISHIDSFMMSDCLRLAMIVPFIFNRFLKPQHFKKTELTLFQQRIGLSRNDLAVKHWLKCWIL
ncbi:36922_t:CDS:2, partial [Gigaspora margarita]